MGLDESGAQALSAIIQASNLDHAPVSETNRRLFTRAKGCAYLRNYSKSCKGMDQTDKHNKLIGLTLPLTFFRRPLTSQQ